MRLSLIDQLDHNSISLVRTLEDRLFPQWPAAQREEFHQRIQGL